MNYKTPHTSFVLSMIKIDGFYEVKWSEAARPNIINLLGQYVSNAVAIEKCRRVIERLDKTQWEVDFNIQAPDNMKWIVTATDVISQELQKILERTE